MYPGPAARKPDLEDPLDGLPLGRFRCPAGLSSQIQAQDVSGSREMNIRGSALFRFTSSAAHTSPHLPEPSHAFGRKSRMDVDRATFSVHMTITRATEGCHGPGPVHNNCAPQGWGSHDKLEHRAAASWAHTRRLV